MSNQPDLAFANELGLERAVPIAGRFDLEIAFGAGDGFPGPPVPAVAGVFPVGRVLRIAQMVGHFGFQGAFDEALLDFLQNATVFENLFLRGVLGQ